MKTVYTCFPDGKHKVLTMSYDDGKEEDRRLVAVFNQYGIKGTFHINSGLFYDPRRIKSEELKDLYQGHEVASHTYTHPTIARCPLPSVVRQVMKDRAELETIMGYPIRGLSYPNGSYSDPIIKILPSLGIRYSRIVGDSDNFNMPRDYYEWKATCHHNHQLLEHGKNFIELAKRQHLHMMYVWGHSYEFEQQNNWELIEEFCKMIGNHDDVWYATNIQIVDYIEAAERLQFATDLSFVYNPSFMSVWLSVDDQIMEIPGGKQITLE